MKKFIFGVSLILLFFGLALHSVASEAKKKKGRVVINFQDELLRGNVSSPNPFHLFHNKQLDYGRFIKFRKNFLPEMRRTAQEIQ